MPEMELTKVIKMTIAIRATYRLHGADDWTTLQCEDIVPHPKNRGGDVIRSARTRELGAQIFADGFDPSEASVNNLVVHAGRTDTGDIDPRFTNHFLENAGRDPDSYVQSGRVYEYAGVCHNTGEPIE